jgi:hypothetical protein
MINIFPLSLFWYCDKSKTYFSDYTVLVDYIAEKFKSSPYEEVSSTVYTSVEVFRLLPFIVIEDEMNEHPADIPDSKLLYGFRVRPGHSAGREFRECLGMPGGKMEIVSIGTPSYFYITDIIKKEQTVKTDLSSVEKWILVPSKYSSFKDCKIVVINNSNYGI